MGHRKSEKVEKLAKLLRAGKCLYGADLVTNLAF